MGKGRNIAILMNLSRLYDRQVIRGVSRYVHSHGSWRLYIEESPADKIPSLAAWSGDGLIVDLDDSRVVQALGHFKVPIVGIGCVEKGVLGKLGISTVRTDDEMIGAWAAEHLLEKGLENFAYCGARCRALDKWSEVRRDSFCGRIADAGFKCSIFSGRSYAARNWDLMQAELVRWLAKLARPVGVMTCNDSRGRHVLEACRALGFSVPEDVAVIGVDNDELMCELAEPPLSSIAQGTEQIGFEAAKLLGRLLDRRNRKASHIVVEPVCLVARQSTDLVAIKDELVSAAEQFIREHGCELIGVDDVVNYCGVSRSTVENRFKDCLGRTVHDEIQRVRLNNAKRLLTMSNLPLHVIAERSGYRSAHYMSAVFRREFDKTPGEFRRTNDG